MNSLRIRASEFQISTPVKLEKQKRALMTSKNHIVLVEDDPLIRETVHRQRARIKNCVMAVLDDPSTYFQPVQYKHARCALFGLSQFKSLGRRLTGRIQEVRKMTKVILLLREAELREALDYINCCDGFVFVDRHLARLNDIIDLTRQGYCLMPGSLLPVLVSTHLRLALLSDLSRKENSALALLGQGLTNKAIAENLLISEATVKNLVRSVLKKLHFRNRTEAGIFAYRHRVPMPESRNRTYGATMY